MVRRIVDKGFVDVFDGDVFTSGADALGHGVNTHGLMGAGVAALFRHRVVGLYDDYRAACRAERLQPGECLPYPDPDGRWWYNLASQDRPGPYARLEWVESSVLGMLTHAAGVGLSTVAIPQIGCGIGGLEWVDVKDALERACWAAPMGAPQLQVWVYTP